MSDFTVDPDDLTAYAGDLERTARLIAEGTPGPRPPGEDAYGLLGTFFAGAASRSSAAGVRAVARACDDLRIAARVARICGADYLRTDQAAADAFRALRR